MKGCTLIEGHARFEAPDRVRVGDDLLTAPRIFINVGGRPSVPPLPGVNDVPFLTNRTILELDQVPEHLLVVGGSYIGLEFAQMHRRFGGEGHDRRDGCLTSSRARMPTSPKRSGRS